MALEEIKIISTGIKGKICGYSKLHSIVRDLFGSLHIYYSPDDDPTVVYETVSGDNGKTWGNPPWQSGFVTSNFIGFSCSAAVDFENNVHLIFNLAASDLAYTRWSYVDGWNEPTIRGQGLPDVGTFSSNIATGLNAQAHAVWSSKDIGYIFFDGADWSSEHDIGNGGWHPDIFIDDNGGRHVTYNSAGFIPDKSSNGASPVTVLYIYSSDGVHWTSEVNVPPNDGVWKGGSTIKVDSTGRRHVTYIEWAKLEGDLYYTYSDDGLNWSSPYKLNVFPGVQTGMTGNESAAMLLDSNNNLYVVWKGLSDDTKAPWKLYLRWLNKATGEWSILYQIASLDDSVGSQPSLPYRVINWNDPENFTVDVTWNKSGEIFYAQINFKAATTALQEATISPAVTKTQEPESRSTSTPKPTDTLSPTNTPSPTPKPNWLVETYKEKRSDSLFWIITTIVGVVFMYLAGVAALIIRASRIGSRIFSNTWLTKIAAKPLLVMPGLGKWALFIGYKKRLSNQKEILKVATEKYFGLPAIDSAGNYAIPDYEGNSLHNLVASSVGAQNPLVIMAKGGGGKTTVAARLAYLALINKLPAQLNKFLPIFVTSDRYEENLIKTISNVLSKRDHVAVNEKVVKAQLESGGYLILFDGVSEIEGNQSKALKEILDTACNADYQGCRFVITTRPGFMIPEDIRVINLKPLTTDTIKDDLLPTFSLENSQRKQILKLLDVFSSKPIEPLLFSMIFNQRDEDFTVSTRSQLYENYFRKLLLIDKGVTKEEADRIWKGWSFVLGMCAKWMYLDSGFRGVGINYEALIEQMSKRETWYVKGSLLEEANYFYGFPEENKFRLLDKLKSSRIMTENQRLRFEHDTFEEYYVASHIIWLARNQRPQPNLGMWSLNDLQIESFIGVIEFIKEMADDEVIKKIMTIDLSKRWREILMPQSKGNE